MKFRKEGRRELPDKSYLHTIMPTYLLIAGTRPEVIKLAPVASALRQKGATAEFCAIGQHGDLLDRTFADFGEIPLYTPIHFRPGRSPDSLLAEMLEHLPPLFRTLSPDGILVQGDTTTALGGALAAFYGGLALRGGTKSDATSAVARSAPDSAVARSATVIAGALRAPAIIHIEAGLRTYAYTPCPEEGHRRMIAPLADLHLAPTQQDADALYRERVPGRIAVTGNSGLDGLRMILSRPAPPLPVVSGRIVLCTLHRRENGEAMPALLAALRKIVQSVPDVTVLYPAHPSPALLKASGESITLPRLQILPPLPYPVCAHLLPRLTLLLTDSGGLQEEAAYLGVPTLVLRQQSERGEAPSLKIIGTNPEKMASEAIHLLTNEGERAKLCQKSNRYGDGYAARRMAEEILRFNNGGSRG